MDDTEFLDPFERLLDDVSSPAQVRAAQGGAGIAALWGALAESGFLDALVPEQAGGVGLTLRAVGPLVEALGAHATPAPVAETMVARALLAGAGIAIPTGPIVLATGAALRVPLAMVAEHVLLDTGVELRLCRLNDGSRQSAGVPGSLAADLVVDVGPAMPRPADGLRPIAAVLRAAQIAGAASRLLDMTVAYANERSQFGKPIGKQQAIQQQLSVMAEKMVMARMAARIGTACALLPTPAAAATAKSVASAAAVDIAAIAHAVHGAIGISEEHDLQLLTRGLHDWRMADGSEGYWSAMLGRARLKSEVSTSADFIRTLSAPA